MGNKVTERKWIGISRQNKTILLLYFDYRSNVQKKSLKTVYNESNTLRKLARCLDKTVFKDITEKDLQSFFGNSNNVKNNLSRDLYATHIIKFYNWLFKLKRKQRPEIMEWFEYQTSAQKRKDIDPNMKEKNFITREEYEKLLQYSPDLQEKALWETLYLSGARSGEICSVIIEGVKELENGYEITVLSSKTQARNIPLSEFPEHLLRWVSNHPFRDHPEHCLWISHSTSKLNNPMNPHVINWKLKKAIQRSGIKQTITPHCFRKTRATIMFPKFTDKEMSLHFGWTLMTVPQRRAEYDLTDHEDLRNKIFGDKPKLTWDALKHQKETLEGKHEKEIKAMQRKINAMKKDNDEMLKVLLEKVERLEETKR